MKQVQDDEIDLFDLFQTLWNGKWLISAFVVIAVLFGGGFLFLKDVVYESKLIYSVDTIPPFYKKTKASTDFQNKFFSVSAFEEWKQNNSNTSLVFEDFSTTELIDGFVLSKNEGKKLVKITPQKKDVSFIVVKSNQLPLLDEFFKYANYINELLAKQYVARAKDELKIIERRFKEFPTANDDMISNLLAIDRYIVSVEKGASVFTIQRPTIPKKVSPMSSLILVTSLVLGGMVGVLFILVRNAIKKRKEQLAKA